MNKNQDEIRVILFSLKKEPTNLQKELNFVFKNFLKFTHYYVKSKNDNIFKKFKDLKYSNLPSLLIVNEEKEPIWHDKIDKLNLIENFNQHGIEQIPKLKSIEMLNDYCFYEDFCFIYSTKLKKIEKKIFDILKKLKNKNERISIIENKKNEKNENFYEKMKEILKIKKKNFFFCLNLKKKEFKIFDEKEFNTFELKDWMKKIKNQNFEKFESNSFVNENFKKNSFKNYFPLIISFLFFLTIISIRFLLK